MVGAVRHFRPYLLVHPCVVCTDHTACLSILNTARPSGKLARWALTIQEMDITIRHKLGRKITNADALSHYLADESRISVVEELKDDRMPCLPDLKEVSECQLEDADMAAMIVYLQDGTRKTSSHAELYWVVSSLRS